MLPARLAAGSIEVSTVEGMMQRSCMVCRIKADKAELLRLVVDDDGQVWPDVLQKAPGRGAYVCREGMCLSRVHDRQLERAWKGSVIAPGQAEMLRQRAIQARFQLCQQGFRRMRSALDIGRDAVMHRMWKKTPLLVLLASDAGAALARQVEDACGKRQAAGLKTTLVIFGDSATLGDIVERDIVSVLALDNSPSCASLRQYCLIYRQLCV
ncbi:MAG: YlxR family protein [Mariprofundaceae bacterium]|nr:YlxR family protein [Mariprofundaceae bacterium]